MDLVVETGDVVVETGKLPQNAGLRAAQIA
jgi:hypothetical protein